MGRFLVLTVVLWDCRLRCNESRPFFDFKMKQPNTTLPGNEQLSQNEAVVTRERFVSSLLTFYVKATMLSTNKRLLYHYPNIVLALIPLGFNSVTFNLHKISSVSLKVEYKVVRIALGLIVGILTIPVGIGVVILIWGLLGIKTHIVVGTSGGETKWPIIFWQKQKAKNFIASINLQLAELEDESNKNRN